MSAWPEVVWLKNQIQNLITIEDSIEQLQQKIENYPAQIESLNTSVDNFKLNDFFTTIIPQNNFGGNNDDYNYSMFNYGSMSSTTVKFKQEDYVKINGATVFLSNDNLTANTPLTNAIKKSLNNKYAAKTGQKINSIVDLTNTEWTFTNTTIVVDSQTAFQDFHINFIIDGTNYKTLRLFPNHSISISTDDSSFTMWRDGETWKLNSQTIQVTGGVDCYDDLLIAWFLSSQELSNQEGGSNG